MEFFWQLLNFSIFFGIVTLLFALLYKLLPDVKVKWDDVWTGAIITSFLLGATLLVVQSTI
ncbi:Ribonuclease BN [Richelia intracellularis]|nr:Ribonuclease BN [Richelia intracellularis]